MISAESLDPVSDYQVIRSELEAYNPVLLEKKEYLFISKSDTISQERVREIIKKLKPLNSSVAALSIHDTESIEKVKQVLNSIANEKIA